ncbi:hypothetical protein O181_047444 [Austropuccinia psidii MF-1]|uniref:Uncharacterized protein n=1 Tax=Austropuccinia psidii MF-1 TaxID=1389203 RepID=A0A9Q3HM34_9BASI|nr:hypothetical protein [Austropuccinia psidii MF-1]
MTPALEKEDPVASASSISVQRKSQRTSEEALRSQDQASQGKRQGQWALTLPTSIQDPQIRAFSRGQCIQYGQSSYETYRQGAGKD